MLYRFYYVFVYRTGFGGYYSEGFAEIYRVDNIVNDEHLCEKTEKGEKRSLGGERNIAVIEL